MVGSGPDQVGPHQAEFAGSQRQDDFLNLERERDRERYRKGSVHTTHTSRSHSRVGSHVSQKQNNNKAMQLEIDNFKKKLRRAQQKRTPSSSNMSSNDEDDDKYRRRPIYYIRRSVHEVEICYLSLKNAILAVVHATRKLPHYFQMHTVVVLTQLPLGALLRSAQSHCKNLHSGRYMLMV